MKYKMFVGTQGRIWLTNSKHIVCCSPLDQSGCYGEEQEFALESGESFKWKGPWISNYIAFTHDTGVTLDEYENNSTSY